MLVVILLILVQRSQVLQHVIQHNDVLLRLLRQEGIRSPPTVAECGIASLTLPGHLLLGIFEVVTLRNGHFAALLCADEHVAGCRVRHTLDVVL